VPCEPTTDPAPPMPSLPTTSIATPSAGALCNASLVAPLPHLDSSSSFSSEWCAASVHLVASCSYASSRPALLSTALPAHLSSCCYPARLLSKALTAVTSLVLLSCQYIACPSL
jgi:hypothetical protein